MSKEVAGVLASGMTDYRDEFRIVAKDGQTKWIEVIATVERSESGEATRMYGVNLDITERKAVAERIRSSELQLRLITDSIPALVSYVDLDERYQFVNMRYAEWFGIEPGQIVGHSLTEVLGDAAGTQGAPDTCQGCVRVRAFRWMDRAGRTTPALSTWSPRRRSRK